MAHRRRRRRPLECIPSRRDLPPHRSTTPHHTWPTFTSTTYYYRPPAFLLPCQSRRRLILHTGDCYLCRQPYRRHTHLPQRVTSPPSLPCQMSIRSKPIAAATDPPKPSPGTVTLAPQPHRRSLKRPAEPLGHLAAVLYNLRRLLTMGAGGLPCRR